MGTHVTVIPAFLARLQTVSQGYLLRVQDFAEDSRLLVSSWSPPIGSRRPARTISMA